MKDRRAVTERLKDPSCIPGHTCESVETRASIPRCRNLCLECRLHLPRNQPKRATNLRSRPGRPSAAAKDSRPKVRHGSGPGIGFHLGRYENALLISTSNLPFARWSDVFGDPVVASAMIDCIVHFAEVITSNGGSCRLRITGIDRLPFTRAENRHTGKPETSCSPFKRRWFRPTIAKEDAEPPAACPAPRPSPEHPYCLTHSIGRRDRETRDRDD